MVTDEKRDMAVENQAAALLSAARAQVYELDRVLSISRDSRLTSAREQAMDAVGQIRAAMQSGDLTASTLAALAASVNIGVDASFLAAESESSAIAARMNLGGASIDSHMTVSRMATDLFDRHEFDADVARHTHGAELEAFKKRQRESEKYIREQLGRGTPEGDLNASGRMQGFMLDADAHGAGDNPDFPKKWDELTQKTNRLRETMRAAGRSTEEYDIHIRENVNSFLRARGLNDGQIEEALQKHENPIDAVKPYLENNSASASLANDLRRSREAEKTTEVTVTLEASQKERPLTIDLDAMDAKLAAAGLAAPAASEEAAGHGLAIQKTKERDTISR
jgi:hypothetical protein